jgi:predicted nucleotidyltransferase
MGNNETPLSGLAAALFSKVQQRVLTLIFSHPRKEFSTSDVIRDVASGTGAVHRELARLASSGIVNVKEVGNQKRYEANRRSPIYRELRSLITKTTGVAEPLREALSKYKDKIHAAFVYGSTARGADTSRSDIDLMILAEDVAYGDIFTALASTERKLGRKISPNLMTLADWKRKLQSKNSFISGVAVQPKLFIFGLEEDVRSPQ